MDFRLTPQFIKDAQKLKKENPKLTSKVLDLIIAIELSSNEPLSGIGQPELLKGNLSGCYSRRINQKHRLIYRYSPSYKVDLLSCYGHYTDR